MTKSKKRKKRKMKTLSVGFRILWKLSAPLRMTSAFLWWGYYELSFKWKQKKKAENTEKSAHPKYVYLCSMTFVHETEILHWGATWVQRHIFRQFSFLPLENIHLFPHFWIYFHLEPIVWHLKSFFSFLKNIWMKKVFNWIFARMTFS